MNWTRTFSAVGRPFVSGFGGFGHFSLFVASAGAAAADVRTWLPQLPTQMRRLGVNSIPIAIFLAGFTGIVMALQASYTFTGAIPIYFVGVLVGKTIILELGPVLTGLALSGRVGRQHRRRAGDHARLGADRRAGDDGLQPHVVPGGAAHPGRDHHGARAGGFANVVGIGAGWITAINLLDMSSTQFVRGLRLFHDPFDITYSLIKAASFGFVITVIGCYQGFNTSGGAEGVGTATTRAVVIASMMILVLDAFWAAVLLQ
jgi:phospholipid/cholesterol/gamma-HCH transport system permease protein